MDRERFGKEPPKSPIDESFHKVPGDTAPLFKTRSTITAHHASTLFLGILAIIAVGFVLKTLGHLVVPLLVAFFLSYLLWPLVHSLRQRRVPGSLAVVIALLAVVGVMGIFGLIMHQSFRSFIREAPKYELRLQSWAERFTHSLGPYAKELERRETLEKIGGAAANTAMDAVGSLVTSLTTLALILIYLLFILFGRLSAGDRVGRAFPPARAEKVRGALKNVDAQVLRYLGTKTLINLATGMLVGVTCALLGIDFAVLWGFLAFLMSYIPYIGSIISPIPPTLLALLQYPEHPWRPVIVGLCLAGIVLVMFNLVEPKVMGDSLGISPLVVMFALLFFGWMWGVWGMVLSIPLAATVKILCENFEATKPIAVFME